MTSARLVKYETPSIRNVTWFPSVHATPADRRESISVMGLPRSSGVRNQSSRRITSQRTMSVVSASDRLNAFTVMVAHVPLMTVDLKLLGTGERGRIRRRSFGIWGKMAPVSARQGTRSNYWCVRRRSFGNRHLRTRRFQVWPVVPMGRSALHPDRLQPPHNPSVVGSIPTGPTGPTSKVKAFWVPSPLCWFVIRRESHGVTVSRYHQGRQG